MSVVGKKLNPIQANNANNVGHGDETPPNDDQEPAKTTPDDVLKLKTIADDYLCRPGENSIPY